jgi:hypothetical protein
MTDVFHEVCEPYRAMMRSMQGSLTPENIVKAADLCWIWAKGVISHAAPETQSHGAHRNAQATSDDVIHARITVKAVTKAGEGTTSKGRPWTRFTVADTESGLWNTFSRNVEAGKTYDIEYTENDLGRTIKKFKGVGKTYMTIPDNQGGQMLDEAEED